MRGRCLKEAPGTPIRGSSYIHWKGEANYRLDQGTTRHVRTANALAHYKEQEIFNEATLESIDFEPVKMVLAAKPKMYNLWHGKQCSGFCGTGKWLKIRSQGKEDYRCPNYHHLQEDAAHLMVCPCANRTKLLHEGIDDLVEWMKLHHTEPALAKVVGIYLRGRGRCQFCVPGLPYRLWDVTTAQDQIS